MIFLTRPLVLICISVSAGMVAQETVTRLSTGDEHSEDDLLGALGVWSTAEGYYKTEDVSHFLQAAVSQIPDGPDLTTAYNEGITQTGHDLGHPDVHLHPREIVQGDSLPSATVVTPNVAAPEEEPSIVQTLPPPSKPTPIPDVNDGDDSTDRPERAGYARTRVDVPPPTSRHTVPPVRPMLSSTEPIRYLDPAEAVQRRAQLRAEERRRRIEAWKWLGYTPLRPPVGATPFTEGDSRRPAVIVIPYVVHVRD